jgi:uncharacterized protein YjdB
MDVYYVKDGEMANKLFTMKDSHGNTLTGLGNLFTEGAYVHAILDTVNGFAYIQNPDTNGYLESKFGKCITADNFVVTGTPDEATLTINLSEVEVDSEGSGGDEGSSGLTEEHIAQIQKNTEDISKISSEITDLKNSGVGIAFDYLTEEVEEEIPCTGLVLNKSTLTFNGNGQETLIAAPTPSDTTDSIIWSSSNKNVATVSNGVVTAIGNGDCTITATCGSITATCSVSISGISTTVSVTGITLDRTTASVDVDSTITLVSTIQPTNASNQNVTWSSDNETVAKVVDGVVTGISKGTATIGVMTEDGGFSATCNVTVNEVQTVTYRNLFDKNTMVTTNQGISGHGVIGSHNWGLARVPVKENTQYSIKMSADYDGTTSDAKREFQYYNCAIAGAFGFADSTGNTLISRLGLSINQTHIDNNTNGANALLYDYAHDERVDEGYVGWVTFTTPSGCEYLLFNTTLKQNADQIQLEEGDTIHNYYLPYEGSE